MSPQEKPSTSQTMTNGDQHSAKPVADLSALAEITGGDEAQLRKYIKMFLDGVPGQLESVGAAIDAADFDNARRRIHAMKPHLKFMGMKHAAGLADSIEQLCQEEHRDAPRIVREFSEVRSQCELAFTELSAKM